MDVPAVMVARRVKLGDQRLLGVGIDAEGRQAGDIEAGNTLVELTINPKTIIDKDLLGFGHARMDGETEKTALPGGIELTVLRVDLENLRLGHLTRAQAGHHLDFAAEVGGGLLLLVGGLIRFGRRSGIALLDDEDDVLAAGHRGDRDGETEGQAREGLVQSDRLLGERRGSPEREGKQESEERT